MLDPPEQSDPFRLLGALDGAGGAGGVRELARAFAPALAVPPDSLWLSPVAEGGGARLRISAFSAMRLRNYGVLLLSAPPFL